MELFDKDRQAPSLALADAAPEYINLLGALWRRKWWVVAALLLAWSAGGAAYTFLPKTYQSEAQLLVMRKALDVRPSGSPAAEPNRSNPAVHEQVLSSPVVISRAVEVYDLLSLESLRQAEKPLEKITKSLRAQREAANPYENQDSLFTLSYRATVPEDPPRVLSALITSFSELLNDIERENRAAAKPMLKKWRDQVAAELNAKEDAYRRMQHIPEHLDVADVASTDVPQARLARLETQKQEWSVRRAQIQRQLGILKEAEEQGIDAALLAELEARWAPQLNGQNPLNDSLALLLNKERELVAEYGPRHPSVLAIREQLGGVRPTRRMQTAPAEAATNEPVDSRRTVEVHIAALEKELEVALAVERVLDTSLQEARRQVGQAAQVAQQAELLRAEITQLQQLHRDLVNQLEVADFGVDTEYYATRLLAMPTTSRKVAPSATLLAVVATALGGCGGMLLALLRDVCDRRLRSADRIERTLLLPVVGQVPRLRGRAARAARAQGLDRQLVLAHRPDSRTAEALRSTLWAALYAGERRSELAALQVTGATPAAGASLIAANLAMAAAETGRSVLLVDANLRAPRLRTLFGLKDAEGLETVLRSAVALDQVVRPTPVRGLHLVSARRVAERPTSLMHSPALRELLEMARRDYDLTIIDTPSPLQVTDAYVVSREVDGVLLVVRPDTPGPAALQCRRALASLHANVLGVVVSGVSPRVSRAFQPLATLPPRGAAPPRLGSAPHAARADLPEPIHDVLRT